MLQYKDKISDISALATNEATLETMLNRIIDLWKKTDFRLVSDNTKDTFIITGTDEIQIFLEESQVNYFRFIVFDLLLLNFFDVLLLRLQCQLLSHPDMSVLLKLK